MACQWLFALALIPQVRNSWNGMHVNGWTAFLTCAGLLVISVCMLSLGLVLTFISGMASSLTWGLIWGFRFKGGRGGSSGFSG